jgi:hypothetical protein
VWNPFAGKEESWQPPGGGRGYYRPASLVGIWATAPFLHNNSVGRFTNDPSVAGRLTAFDDAITKLIVPGANDAEAASARWAQGTDLNGASEDRLRRDRGLIWRLPRDVTFRIPASYLPLFVSSATGFPVRWLHRPWALPAVVLFVAGLLLFVPGRVWRLIGIAAVCVALLVGVARYFEADWTRSLPSWTVRALFLFGLGLLILVLLSLVRFVAILCVLVTLPVGAASYFAAGRIGDLVIGTFPATLPVNSFANVDYDPANCGRVARALFRTARLTWRLRHLDPDVPQSEAIRKDLGETLLSVTKSPDFVMDRGHYFGSALSAQQRKDLISLLRTF